VFRRIQVKSVLIVAIGSVIGFAAATGKLNLDQRAWSQEPSPVTTADGPSAIVGQPTGRSHGVNVGKTIALAAHNPHRSVRQEPPR